MISQMSSKWYSSSLRWHKGLSWSSLVYLLNLISCHSFLSYPILPPSFPPSLLPPSQMDYPPNCGMFSFWRYTLPFSLLLYMLAPLSRWEHLLPPTHTSSPTPKETLSFISETASPRKPPLIPQEGPDSPLTYQDTCIYFTPRRALCSCIRIPYLFVFTRDCRLCLVHVLSHSRHSIYTSQMNEWVL